MPSDGDTPRPLKVAEVERKLASGTARVPQQHSKLVDDVIAAARECKRGCDCEYDYRCGNCEAIIVLREALIRLDNGG